MTARVMPARIAGSPSSRLWWPRSNQFQQAAGLALAAGPDREVVGVLGAAVQHDDQGKPTTLGAARNIDLVVPGARRAGEASREVGGFFRHDDGRRLP